MKIEQIYVLNGTENEDLNSPKSPFQGKTLSTYTKVDGEWSNVFRDQSGAPNLGYLAKEITAAEAARWRHRIIMAAADPVNGYMDADGHWFTGEAVASVITIRAWDKLQVFKQDSFYRSTAGKHIDRLADSVMEHNHPRDAEYAARYQEAVELAAHSDPKPEEFPYLYQLRYKGLSLQEAAKLVIEKYTLAQANDVLISDLRAKKALLTGNVPLVEKKELYNSIVAGLMSAKV